MPKSNATNTRYDMAHREARARRRAYVAELTNDSRLSLAKLLAANTLPHLGTPGIMASYVAIGSEISPEILVEQARTLGWQIALPRVAQENAPLKFHLARHDELRPGFANIPEPEPDAPAVCPTLILIPLLAADLKGNRLGQGGGYYDRTLADLRQRQDVRAIGIAWESQIQPQLTPKPWDEPLDAIATPAAFHLCRRSSKAKG